MTETFKKVAGLEKYFESAYGWAAFPNVGKAGAMIGAAGGPGKVFAKVDGPDAEPKHIANSVMSQVDIGLQFGAEVFSEIIFFENKEALDTFSKGFEFSSKATVTVVSGGGNVEAGTTGGHGTAQGAHVLAAAGGVGYVNGMATFAVSKGGMLFSATIGGQKFTYKEV